MAPIPQKTKKQVRKNPQPISTDEVFDAYGNSVTDLMARQTRRDRNQDNEAKQDYSHTVHTNEAQELEDTQQQQGRENLNAMIDILNPDVTLDSTQVTAILTKLGLQDVLTDIANLKDAVSGIQDTISDMSDSIRSLDDRVTALENE